MARQLKCSGHHVNWSQRHCELQHRLYTPYVYTTVSTIWRCCTLFMQEISNQYNPMQSRHCQSFTYGRIFSTTSNSPPDCPYNPCLLFCRNCLVGRSYIVKVSELGNGRTLYAADYCPLGRSQPLPLRWMAWESVLLVRILTHFVDT